MSTNPFETLTSPHRINEIIENVLLITLNPENPNKSLYFMNEESETQMWTLEMIEFSLFERLMSLASEGGDGSKVVLYLYESFLRLHNENRGSESDVSDVLSSLIFRNLATALKEPELFSDQDISAQFLTIFKDSEIPDTSVRDEFLSCTVLKALEDSDDGMRHNVKEIFFKCFDECVKVVRQSTMVNLPHWILSFLIAFSSDKNNSAMANILLDYITPQANCDGIKYADSLLGK